MAETAEDREELELANQIVESRAKPVRNRASRQPSD
jgi:hypothetical protein